MKPNKIEVKDKIEFKTKYTKQYLKQLDEELPFVPLVFDQMFKSTMERNIGFFERILIKTLKLKLNKEDSHLVFLDKELVKGSLKEKGKIVDLNVKFGSDLLVLVEINTKYYKYVENRNNKYMYKIDILQFEVGNEYKILQSQKIYQLNLNANLKEPDKVPSRTIVEYDLENNVVTNTSRVKVLKNLVRYKEMYYNEGEKFEFDDKFMVALLSESYTELYDIMSEISSGEELERFMDTVVAMNKDEFVLHEWEKEKFDKEIREKELAGAKEEGIEQGIEQGIERGIEQGVEKEKISSIKEMLKNGLNYDIISKVTSKTIEEIKEIEKSMNIE